MSSGTDADDKKFTNAERIALGDYDHAPRFFHVIDAICLAGFRYVVVRIATSARPVEGTYEAAIERLLRVAGSIWPAALNLVQYFYVSRRPHLVVRYRAVHRILFSMLCWRVIYYFDAHR